MPKVTMSSIRAQFPMYGDVPDDQLLMSLHKKHYADIPAGQFYSNIDYDTERERLNKSNLDSMSWGEKADAATGKAMHDIWRVGKRAANAVGIGDYDAAAAAEDQRLDAPLMADPVGGASHTATNVAATLLPGYRAAQLTAKGVAAGARALPQALAPTATAMAPFAGAVGAGAGVGAITNPADISGGAATGAAWGGAGELGGRVAGALYQGSKAMLEPLYQGGRERILKRTFERFADDPSSLSSKVATAPQHVKGVQPTMAEATLDPGIAQLQRSSAAASPEVANALQGARNQQLSAYRSELDRMSGAGGRYEGAVAKRGAQADALYGTARQLGLDPVADPMVASLMQRPAIAEAMDVAVRNAKNRGVALQPQGSVEGMQQVSSALDGMISQAKVSGNTDALRSLMQAKQDLLAYLDVASPWHSIARQEFAKASGPINQMEMIKALRDKALPALTDTQGVPSRVNANAFAQALREGDKTAAKATGFPGATMEGTLSKTQQGTLQGIERDMGRYAAAQDLGGIPGSRTAQHMGAANIVNQMLGPLGFSRSVSDATVGRIATGILGLPFRFTQSQTEQLLAKAFTNPAVAQRILAAKDPQTIAQILQPFAAPLAIQTGTTK